MDWYYAANGQQVGPVSDVDFDRLITQGQIGLNTHVWREGLPDWITWEDYRRNYGSDLATVATATLPQSAAACCQCHRYFSTDEMISHGNVWVCGDCKEVYFQHIREGTAQFPGAGYAGFWIRAVAVFLDGVITWFCSFVIMFLFSMVVGLSVGFLGSQLGAAFMVIEIIMGLIFYAALLLYEPFFISRYGATLGKMAVGIRVICTDGSRVGFWRAVGRSLAKMLSAIILYIGFIIAGFDKRKQALHDNICGTLVVYKRRG